MIKRMDRIQGGQSCDQNNFCALYLQRLILIIYSALSSALNLHKGVIFRLSLTVVVVVVVVKCRLLT